MKITLALDKDYTIAGKQGIWRFSNTVGRTKYVFMGSRSVVALSGSEVVARVQEKGAIAR